MEPGLRAGQRPLGEEGPIGDPQGQLIRQVLVVAEGSVEHDHVIEPGQRAVLTAYGPSAAPYRAFIRELRERRHEDPVQLLHLVDAAEPILFERELEGHAGECGWFRYTPLGMTDADRPVLEPDVLEALLEDKARTVVFACGANAFVDDVVARAAEAGLPAENIRKEKWG